MNPQSSEMQGAVSSSGEDEAAAAIQQMFSSIAPRYDLLNHLLSLNVDRLWWRRAARAFAPIVQRPGARILDLCCGTGEMAFALAKVRGAGNAEITGCDFSAPMLALARRKSARIQNPPSWLQADALSMPLPGAGFDLVVSAFGFRNLASYDRGLREIARVLKSGGEIGILEFSRPSGALGRLYSFYFGRILPRIGAAISGVRGPYEYLPASVARFPSPPEMLERMRAAGFRDANWTPYTFGVAGLFRAIRA
ncbi:MAG: ubiquinone/menaquinone biosynthesis methyltransferase [Acidobacteria bacterium]|nr:ubiquinone/menaquinone biosynthesis methyltransferase [Acidobacteriota bacterium]